MHWAIGAAVVVGFGLLTVATCGMSVAAAATAVCMVGSGVAAATTASTVAAAAFIGSATVYGTAVIGAASESYSLDDFATQGNWGTVISTVGGGLVDAWLSYTPSNTPAPVPTSKVPNPYEKKAVRHINKRL